jgi:hypothetical protein
MFKTFNVLIGLNSPLSIWIKKRCKYLIQGLFSENTEGWLSRFLVFSF